MLRKAPLVILAVAGYLHSLDGKDFEAAFQGECREDSPCQHFCFDLHDGTFECACQDGYTLAVNGYSCIENSKLQEQFNSSLENGTDELYELDDVDQLRAYRQVRKDRAFSRSPKSAGHLPVELDPDTFHRPISYEHIYDNAGGRSLNSVNAKREKGPRPRQPAEAYQPMNTVIASTPSVRQVFKSCVEQQCGASGTCEPDAAGRGGRCRCPLRRSGPFCEKTLEAKYPRFNNYSYLVLPPLKDAHKSMQVTLEFRPESNDGLILFSGEKQDLQGDFIAVTLNNGFIEFRFDCGMGEGVLVSDQPVVLRSWNMLTIYRDRWDAWMQLNSGSQIQGRSKGLFSRITFRLSLFLGGSPNITLVSERTQARGGFVGCLRRLAINRKMYDFRPHPKGDSIAGVNIDECSADVCSEIKCLNGGQCVAANPDYGVCLCPLGFAGDQCETAMELIVPLFNGSSYLQYPGLSNTFLSFIEVEIVFKPYKLNGVLFYNGYKMDGSGDFISLNLVNGYLEFRFDLGTGVALIKSEEPLIVGMWHKAFISRTGRYGMLQVDRQKKVEGLSPGAFTQLSVPLNMYLGGVHDLRDVAEKAAITDMFTGCMQKVSINGREIDLVDDALSGINIGNCLHSCIERPCKNGGLCEPRLEYYSCRCHLGYAGNNCENEVTEMISEPMFTGASYLHYLDESIVKHIRGNKFDIQFRFRSFGPSGLILWAGKKATTPSSDYLALGLKDGYLNFQYNLGSGEVVIPYNVTKLDDGKWHSVRATRVEQQGTLIVDGGRAITGSTPGLLNQLNINNGLFLGGMDNIANLSMNKFLSGLVGCLANVTLSKDSRIRLITHATTGINIQPCL